MPTAALSKAHMDAVLEEEDLLAILDASLFVRKRRPSRVHSPVVPGHRASPAPSIAGSVRRRRRTPSIRTTDSARLPPFLLLPSELLLSILDLCLPPEHTRQTTPERNAVLRALALVHPWLTSWAQTRLYRDAIVYTDRAVDKLVDLTSRTSNRTIELAKTITSLRVFGPLGSTSTLAKLVQQLPHLESLQLNDLDGLEMRAFVLLPNLKTFEAHRTGFRSRFRLVSQARASPVTTFSVVNCTAHDDAFSGFTLPYVRTLELRAISLPPPSPLAVLEQSEAFKLHAFDVVPRLDKLTTDAYNFALHFPLKQRRFSTARAPTSDLTYLHLVKFSLLAPLVDLLPTGPATMPLSTLRLTPPTSFLPGSVSPEKAEAHFVSLLTPFRLGHAALTNLSTLVLDEQYLAWLESGLERARFEELFDLCERADVEVRFEPSLPELERGGRPRRRRMTTTTTTVSTFGMGNLNGQGTGGPSTTTTTTTTTTMTTGGSAFSNTSRPAFLAGRATSASGGGATTARDRRSYSVSGFGSSVADGFARGRASGGLSGGFDVRRYTSAGT
ncbi:hypothetical protein JCM10212_006801 [Sporobolomyces blumeae]